MSGLKSGSPPVRIITGALKAAIYAYGHKEVIVQTAADAKSKNYHAVVHDALALANKP